MPKTRKTDFPPSPIARRSTTLQRGTGRLAHAAWVLALTLGSAAAVTAQAAPRDFDVTFDDYRLERKKER